MKIPTYELGKRGVQRVCILSDLHIGANEHCGEQLAEAIEYLTEEKVWVILNGDLIENAVIGGKETGDMLMGQADWPTQQWKDSLELFSPLAKSKRILFGTRGNHESRSRRQALLDLCDMLIAALPGEIDYLGVGGLVRIRAGSQDYLIAVQHGASHGIDPYRENRRLAGVFPQAELVALGHNHHLGYETDYHLQAGEDSEQLTPRYLVRTGTFLGYAEYARERTYQPRAVGCPIVSFHTDGHRIEVDVETLKWLI